MSLSRIAFAFDVGTFAVMRALLESEGIHVLDIATGGHLSIAGADQGYYLQVPEDERERAASLLREHDFEQYLIKPGA